MIDLAIRDHARSPQLAAVPRVTMEAMPATMRSSTKPTNADIDERDDDLGDVRGIPRIPDEEADADAADQHFRRDDGEPRQADADAQAGEDVGRRRRHHDLAEELERIEPQHGGDVAIVLRDVADADRGVDDDRPDRGDEDHEDRRRLAVAERRERQAAARRAAARCAAPGRSDRARASPRPIGRPACRARRRRSLASA